MREWLTVIIACLIIGVLLDGLRRMRAAKRGDMRMSLSMHKGVTKEELEAYGSELPNGGARVVGKRDVPASQVKAPKRPAIDKKPPAIEPTLREPAMAEAADPGVADTGAPVTMAATAPKPQPAASIKPKAVVAPPAQQQQLDLDQQVPLLMELDDRDTLASASSRREPSLAPLMDLDETGVDSPRVDSPGVDSPGVDSTRKDAPAVASPAIDEDAYDRVLFSKKVGQHSEPTLEEDRAPDEVFVVNVVAPKGEVFVGPAVKDAILGAGLRYGSHKIFHQHQHSGGEGPVQFSLVNMVKPGVFDLNKFDELETPGLSLFMTLPSEADNIKAYDALIASARRIAEELGGELRDEQHSTLTHQTIEHNRARVSEYQRKRQLDKARI